ncbi:hypothetical protein BBK36DRAFT_139084 [Trichoderma citrinoviride]|uniref:Uncharacterized protein n=1 Tax=Trichoderma citrinoviride TaxID=58853 RepID=A0A2T4BMQ3_9HYPO|nr:hypothetical protein BBK36DRAFT_139084 [Trichoderma citrinoviride]PTB70597.1 hypothetical protein BBK36DRAFT_139084 [Trichoderma citrinoviride]
MALFLRAAYFGPPSSLSEPTARWVSLIPDQMKKGCVVMGLIVDQLAMTKGSFKTLGVCCKATEEGASHETADSLSGQRVTLPAIPEVLRKPSFNTDTVLTRAKLSNIKQLRVLQRDVDVSESNKGLRWCGLWIHHHDGTTETLGLWDDYLTKNARIIYDAERDGRLIRMLFRLRRKLPVVVAPCDDAETAKHTGDVQKGDRGECGNNTGTFHAD